MSGQPWWVWLLTVAAGSLGSVCRFLAVAWLHTVLVGRLQRWAGRIRLRGHLGRLRRAALPEGLHPFPGGVLLANTVAVLGDGLVIGWAAATDGPARVVVMAGFAGGLSTLSTLVVDTVAILGRGQPRQASVNLVANLGCGAVALTAGLALGRALSG